MAGCVVDGHGTKPVRRLFVNVSCPNDNKAKALVASDVDLAVGEFAMEMRKQGYGRVAIGMALLNHAWACFRFGGYTPFQARLLVETQLEDIEAQDIAYNGA